MRQCIDHGQKRTAADRMRKDNGRVGILFGRDAHGLHCHHANGAAIDVFEARILFENHHVGLTMHRHIALFSRLK
jgi:hypothetical protein